MKQRVVKVVGHVPLINRRTFGAKVRSVCRVVSNVYGEKAYVSFADVDLNRDGVEKLVSLLEQAKEGLE